MTPYARIGHHSRPCGSTRSLGRTTTPSTTAAIANRPSVREPGEKLGPTARMPTKAEAHSTTVMMTAATPSLLMRGVPGGSMLGWILLASVLSVSVLLACVLLGSALLICGVPDCGVPGCPEGMAGGGGV